MKRRTKAEWRGLLDAHETSGLTAAAFCRTHALCPKYFSLRRRQLGMEVAKSDSGFAPVSVIPSMRMQTIDLQWGRLILQLPIAIEPQWLAAFVHALQA